MPTPVFKLLDNFKKEKAMKFMDMPDSSPKLFSMLKKIGNNRRERIDLFPLFEVLIIKFHIKIKIKINIFLKRNFKILKLILII